MVDMKSEWYETTQRKEEPESQGTATFSQSKIHNMFQEPKSILMKDPNFKTN